MACGKCGNLQNGDEGYTLQNGCFCSAASFSTPAEVQGGLVASLYGCVDRIRDLKTRLGARQYEVSLIWTKWSGNQRGVGEEYVYREIILQPTPEITDLGGISKTNLSVGLEEAGNLRIQEISPRYSEGDLLGLIDGQRPTQDTNFYWEIRTPPRADGKDIRRRFFPSSAPNLEETQFQWSISLVRAHGDRTPEGLPRHNPLAIGEGVMH